jgi:MoxR-like ATPase
MTTKTARMKFGDTYRVRAGEFAGREARIIDPHPFPDTDLNRRRKITVDIEGEQVYLLPRLLETNVVPLHQPQAPQRPIADISIPHPVTGVPVLIPGDITDADDPRLDPWRPDPKDPSIKKYINRVMPNGQTDVDFLMSFYEKKENVLLVGDTQSGKTLMVSVLAVLAGQKRPSGKPLPVFLLSGSSGVSEFDLYGQPTAFTTPEGGERLVWLPGVVDLACRVDACILYMDEVNMMGERVTSALHSVCDHRRSFVNRMKAVRVVHEGTETFIPEIVKASDGMWIVGTINPAGYKGASMGEAFLNRWVHIPWGYDEAVEKKLIPSATVRLLGQALREARATRAINTPIGTAALSRLCEQVTNYGVETSLWMLTAMFTPQEQPKVEAIIQDRSIKMLLEDEVAALNAPVAPAPQPLVDSFNSQEPF